MAIANSGYGKKAPRFDTKQNAFLESRMTSNRAPDPVDIQVGKTIRAYRIVAGLSQTELAEKLGVTFQQVQKYEKGINRVGAGRLSRIANVLTIDIATLFGSTPAPPARAGDVGVNGFASDRNSLRLIRAFSEIDDRDVRQLLADLGDKIAGWQAERPLA